MPQKKNKKRKQQLQNFKDKKMEQQKAGAAVNAPEKFMVPLPTWEQNDNLDLRGDLLEAFDQSLSEAFEHGNQMLRALQKAGQAMQIVMSQNINAGKMKLDYVWNDGTEPTEKEKADHLEVIEQLKVERQKQLAKAEEGIKEELKEDNQEEEEFVKPREVITLAEINAREDGKPNEQAQEEAKEDAQPPIDEEGERQEGEDSLNIEAEAPEEATDQTESEA